MEDKKYELVMDDTIEVDGHTLYRIRALKDFDTGFEEIYAGDLGGYVESEDNLSQQGNAWVCEEAKVYGNAKVYKDAMVGESALVFDNAQVYGASQVYGNAKVFDNAQVCGLAWVADDAHIYGNAVVSKSAKIRNNAKVYGDAIIGGEVVICDNAQVYGNARVCEFGETVIDGDTLIHETPLVLKRLNNESLMPLAIDKKYELLTDNTIEVDGKTLYRIRAVKDFGNIKTGELGGYVESEANLSQAGNCWVGGNAIVCDNAIVSGNAQVCDDATIRNFAYVGGNARVCDKAQVAGNALVFGSASVLHNAEVYENAWVDGDARVENQRVYGLTKIGIDKKKDKPVERD